MLLAEHKLDGLCEPAGRFGAPYFTIATRADVLDEAVTGKRFQININVGRHGFIPNLAELDVAVAPQEIRRTAADLDK